MLAKRATRLGVSKTPDWRNAARTDSWYSLLNPTNGRRMPDDIRPICVKAHFTGNGFGSTNNLLCSGKVDR